MMDPPGNTTPGGTTLPVTTQKFSHEAKAAEQGFYSLGTHVIQRSKQPSFLLKPYIAEHSYRQTQEVIKEPPRMAKTPILSKQASPKMNKT